MDADSLGGGGGAPVPVARHRPGIRLRGLVEAAGFLSVLASVGAGVGGRWWWGDLLAQFRPAYAIAMAAFALVLLGGRRRGSAAVAILLAIAQTGRIANAFRGGPPSAERSSEPGSSWRCHLANVRTQDPRPAEVLAAVARSDADFIGLLEVDDAWLEGLAGLDRTHPHSIVRPRSDNFGVAFWSRHPVSELEEIGLGPEGLPALAVRVATPAGPVRVLVFHALPPGGPGATRARDAMLDAAAAWVRRQEGPVMVMGDLNTAPWTTSFRRFRGAAGLSAPARWVGTWPSFAGPFGLPLDHVLVGGGLRVAGYRAGDGVGSDHRPLLSEWLLPSP